MIKILEAVIIFNGIMVTLGILSLLATQACYKVTNFISKRRRLKTISGKVDKILELIVDLKNSGEVVLIKGLDENKKHTTIYDILEVNLLSEKTNKKGGF